MTARPCGFSLVELVVALTILSIGILGLTAAATTAQRSFASAQIEERAVRVAAGVLDSLLATPAPASGQRTMNGFYAEWGVSASGEIIEIHLAVEFVSGSGRVTTYRYHASRAAVVR